MSFRAVWSIATGLGVAITMPSAAAAQTPVPIRELAAPDATSASHFGTILAVRPLAGGRLLVDDGRKRQLIILDGQLASPEVLLDSVATSVAGASYGTRASPLIPYLGDSSLFADWSSLSLVVISPSGVLARTMSAPRPDDVRRMSTSQSGIDARGNLVYLGLEPSIRAGAPTTGIVQAPDSAPVVRASFETRTVDTIGRVRVPGASRLVEETVGGQTVVVHLMNPLRTPDEWAVLSDGTILFVRGHDYHIDVVQPDGKRFASAKLPFDWKRLSEADKQALVDSARASREELEKRDIPLVVSASALMAAAAGGTPPKRSDANTPRVREVPTSEIADYWPPIRTGAVRADLDNNAWILPTTSTQSRAGELVYDVVNNKGVLVERVRIPSGRTIAGFGRNGVVYLMYRDGDRGWLLERTAISAASRPSLRQPAR